MLKKVLSTFILMTMMFSYSACNQTPDTGVEIVDSDKCPGGKNCKSTVCSEGECPQLASGRVHLEIDGSAAGYITQQAWDVPLDKNLSTGPITLKRKVYYYGNLVNNRSFANSDIGAIYSDIVAIPEISEEFSKSSAATLIHRLSGPSASLDPAGYFTLALIADQKYMIVINPLGENDIPPTFHSALISADHSTPIMLSEGGSTIIGVLNLPGQLLNSLEGKMSVKVLQGDKLVSAASTLNRDGSYRVELSNPLYAEFNRGSPLKLVIEPNSDYRHLPTIVEKINLDSDDLVGKKISMKPITLENVDVAHESTISIIGDDNTPIKEARIYLKGDVGEYINEQQLQTDVNGMATAKLVPGNYKILIMPPTESAFAMHYDPSVKVDGVINKEFILDKRGAFDGSLSDYTGNPVEGALVQFTRIAKQDSKKIEGPLKNFLLRTEVRTNAQGRFCSPSQLNQSDACSPLRLDEGRYRLSVVPPPGSKLPYYTQVFDFPEVSSLNIVLKNPSFLRGQLVGPGDGSTISKTFVRVFSTSILLESGEPYLIGQYSTDEQGQFVVPISPE